MDRRDRFSDRSGDRFSDRSGDRPGDRSSDGGRHSRMPSRWSSDSPTSQSHRYPRGGGEGFPGGRHHPYRGPSQDYAVGGGGGGPGFRGGPGGFSHQMPNSEQKRGFFGRGDSPEHTDGNKFAKLFIGSVPRTTTEEDIRPLFEEHGDVIEVALIKDRRTGEQQGCCFIKYATAEDADRAIRALHNQYTLPGGSGPIQVRYADGERESLGTVEHKLFVASLNKQATEKEIEEIFSPYGRVEDVYLMRDDMRQSRGCGFVKFSNREMASAAMNALNGIYVMRGCDQPLIVRFANPKRPRPGEQRGGPAFGGPGFGPRSEASTVIRPQSNLDESMGGSLRPNAWDQMSSQSLVPSSQASHHGFANHPSGKDVATSSATPGTLGVPAGPTNGSLPSVATSSSSLQQGFNPSMAHVYSSVGQQILPLQKLLMSPQDLPPSVQLHHTQQILASQAQTLQAPLQQLGQFQIPQSVGLPSSQTLSSQQLHGLGGQLSTSQPLIQQNASAVALQAPLGVQQQGMPAVSNHQQFPSSTTSQQLLQQPIQQFPSQFPQVLLQQQAQALQSSYQSSQQAIMQMQQQLHQMQQGSQTVKHQSPWTGQQSTSSAPVTTTQAAVMPSTVTTSVASTCNWTEHTSPEGFKYYYNSVTRESKWEKPEELTLFEQQQQQQKLLLLQQQQQKIAAQQLPSPSNRQIQPPQQVPQTHEVQAQMQARQQAQLQLLQPSLTYQASGVTGHQNIQDSYYTQLQAASSVIDPARVQQGIQAAQEWAWKNKPAGS